MPDFHNFAVAQYNGHHIKTNFPFIVNGFHVNASSPCKHILFFGVHGFFRTAKTGAFTGAGFYLYKNENFFLIPGNNVYLDPPGAPISLGNAPAFFFEKFGSGGFAQLTGVEVFGHGSIINFAM